MLPLVSVIIPVYNVMPFLKKCLDSVVKQSYSNLEIIVIDDGSTDGSGNFLDDYLLYSCRKIEVSHIKNNGLSNARNHGLSFAKGDYIMFLDGDDWLELEAIGNIVDILFQHEQKIDLLLFPYIREFSKNSVKRKLFLEDAIFFNSLEFKNLIYKKLIGPRGNELKKPEKLDILSTAWGKLYSRDLIKNKFSPYNVAYPEDLLFNIQNLADVKNAVYTEVTALHYNRLATNSSAVTKKFSFDNYLFSNKLINCISSIITNQNLGCEYEERLVSRTILRLFSFMLILSVSSLSFSQKIRYGNSIVKDPINKESFKKFKSSRKSLPKSWQCFYFLMEKENTFLIVVTLFFFGKIRSFING
ncbi:glycosyltransferase family A protein [Leuconostoc mesenteroides]|uniref:glycosyltransferase family A protein n=2 Tax=Leuconostoc mesenteroides TaxID=1245 RepID=UPI00235E1467|nr:glycosyltransferase family A protein [Leuconostoc mesenteroides]